MVGYCHSWRNVFDFMLVAYSIVYIICAGIYLAVDQPLVCCFGNSISMKLMCKILYMYFIQTIEVLTDMGLVLAVLKFFTILGKTVSLIALYPAVHSASRSFQKWTSFVVVFSQSTLQDLTVTIVQTFLKGIPLLGVLLAIMITYTFLGCVLFSGLRTGEDINYR